MDQKLILANGQEFDGSSCGFDGEYSVWCFLKDVSFTEAFQYFSNPASWGTVIFDLYSLNSIHRTTYTGLTELNAIQQARDSVNVRLKGFDIQIHEEDIPIVRETGEENELLHDADQNES